TNLATPDSKKRASVHFWDLHKTPRLLVQKGTFCASRLYHRARAFLVSGCLSANSLSRFRVIMCIRSSVGEPRAFFIFCYLAFPPGCLPGIEGSLRGHKPERTRLVVQPSELPDRRLRRCDLPANPPPQRGRRLGGPRLSSLG